MPLIGGDFAGIEARVVAWLARQEDKLEVFRAYDRGEGPDAYCVAATGIYGKTITKKDAIERSVGKVSELALGYQGGISAYYTMCSPYNLSLAPVVPVIFESATMVEKEEAFKSYESYRKQKEKAEEKFFNEKEGMTADIIKQRWRIKNDKITAFWKKCNDAAFNCLAHGDWRPFNHFHWSTHNWDYAEKRFLYLHLPGGRKLAYFKPKVEEVTTKWGSKKRSVTCSTYDLKTKQMVRRAMYGGLWTENAVQAISRDIMVVAARAVKREGHKLILTVHDELLMEPIIDTPEVQIAEIMTRSINWAPGLPLSVGTFEGMRYQK